MPLYFTLLLSIGLVSSTSDDEETNPFLDAAKALLHDSLQNDRKDSGIAGGIGSLVQHFMQSEGGRQIGDVLQQSGGSDLLAGLGSLLTGRQQGGSGLDPQLVGKVVEMFTGSQDKSEQGGAMEGLINLLPLLANTGHMHHDDPELENEEEHRRHQQATSMFPPFLTSLWNHFITSELGQTLWANSGLAATMQLFQDREGNFQMDRIFQSLENNTFRRRWVRSLTGFVAEWIKHMADPATLKRYMSTAQFVGNGFLKAQGYSKAVLFDPSRPAESLSLMVNAVFKRNFGLKINSATYIKPAVAYIQEVLQLSQSKGLSLSYLSSKDIENKLSETVNNEIIEPILRVWRAYKYAIKVPQCDRYLICTLNQHEPTRENSAGFKPGVTKLASLISSWFLSGNTGTPFWKLYNAAVDDHNCQIKYPVDCSQFHEEDIKATTEYLHNEL